jgi:beta-glucosidase
LCVYNAVNGTPGCASSDLLQTRLRTAWGFEGYVVSDCGAVNDIHRNHKYTPTLGEAAVAAVTKAKRRTRLEAILSGKEH